MTPSSRARCPASRCSRRPGTGTVSVHDGPPNTELRVTLEPLATVVGSGRTDADGDAEIPIQLRAPRPPPACTC